MSENLALTEHSTHEHGPGHRKGYILLQNTGLMDGDSSLKQLVAITLLFFFKDDSIVTLKLAGRLVF